MSAKFQIKELGKIFSFNLKHEDTDLKFSIGTDSRNIKNDQVFLPLTGENFDGHDFINQVLEKNVKYAFCQETKLSKVKEEHKSRLIVVENTLNAYHEIAHYYRRKLNPLVIAITGSSGKTSTKDLVSSVLSTKFKVHKTESNFNNEIGVPKTILEMPDNTKILVLELAMRAKEEIKYLAKTAEPDIAVITNVGTAHIGRLGSAKSIIQAKCELLECLKKDGLAILFNDSNLLQFSQEIWAGKIATYDLNQVKNIEYKNEKSNFEIILNDEKVEKYSVNALGKVHVLNSLCAILIARYLNLSSQEIQSGLSSYELPSGRGNVIKLSNSSYLIDESYNANPDSVKSSVRNLIECWNGNFKKVLVLGELAELGEHKDNLLNDLSKWLADKPLSMVITVGDKLEQVINVKNVDDVNECCDILKKILESSSVVLVKGSHAAKLNKVIECFKR